jgi:rhodanese-related sulfurtransferase/membrane-associated phospholipid phosphatase
MLWLAALAPLFYLSYGFANYVTSLRSYVPSMVFGWESRIPFLAWTIVPYWSTDLFYAVSLFLCRTRAELNTHAKRLLAVQLVCVACFLLFPLRFTFPRPHTDGLFGRMFDVLMGFDKPFNQAPSLHVALTAVLWRKYSGHLHGAPALWLVRCWFTLMALSTLTTYQHHFIDVPTGLWVGLLVLVAIPDNPRQPRPTPSRDPLRWRVGACYLAGAALIAAIAVWTHGAGLLLFWPAGSLAIVGGIYVSGRVELFRKWDGTMPAAMIALLAPYIVVARLNVRRAPLADEIVPGVWLGRFPRRRERDAMGICSMVDVTAEFPADTTGVVYRGVPMLDLLVPDDDRLEAAVGAIDELQTNRPTLVCCALGYSRGASATAAWLVATARATSVDEAIEQIRLRRPRIAVRRALRAGIEAWAGSRRMA